jgi:3-polyprenyl-4-hydroxybenzoate decarboxylase
MYAACRAQRAERLLHNAACYGYCNHQKIFSAEFWQSRKHKNCHTTIDVLQSIAAGKTCRLGLGICPCMAQCAGHYAKCCMLCSATIGRYSVQQFGRQRIIKDFTHNNIDVLASIATGKSCRPGLSIHPCTSQRAKHHAKCCTLLYCNHQKIFSAGMWQPGNHHRCHTPQ